MNIRRIQPWITKTLIILAISIIMALPASHVYPVTVALLLGVMTGIIVIGLFVVNEYFLMPRFFFAKSRLTFILLNALVLIVFASIHALLDEELFKPFKVTEDEEGPAFIFLVIRSLFLFLMANFISITLYLSNTVRQQAIREKNLREEKLGTELKLLKAQINPHFIFNALNNIYALTYTQSEKAPESVLKLSEMLRYVFYDCSKDTVKLKDEIKYIENFISLQRMKSEHEQDIRFDYSEASGSQAISPMLFIPFIENAFKYSKIEELEDAWIRIRLSTQNGRIHFWIENTVPETGKPAQGQGMGIPNVSQRLEVLYPKRHTLKIDEKDIRFTVNLEIQTS